MSTENKSCAPRLRFPGFTGDWMKIKLGDVIKLSKGSQVNGSELNKTSGYPMMNGGSTLSGYYSDYNNEADTIIISEGGNSCGYVNYMTERFWAGGHCYVVSILNDDVKEYVYQLLKAHESKIQALRVGSGLPNIQSKDLLNYEVLFCSEKSEQKKIAECLEEMDNLIAAQGENVDALKEKKKGLMQQLFPQKGEFIPRLRFSGFEDEWTETTLGEIGKCYAGATPSTKENSYWEGGSIPWMNSGEIHQGVVTHTSSFITQKGYDGASTKMLPVNTVLIALAGQGKTRGTVAITAIELCTNQSVCGIVIDDNKIYNKFVYFYLKNCYDDLRKISSGDGSRGGLNLKMIGEYPISIPSFLEQKRIAECLSALEDQITAESAKMEALNDHKKGLMQQLFPQLAK